MTKSPVGDGRALLAADAAGADQLVADNRALEHAIDLSNRARVRRIGASRRHFEVLTLSYGIFIGAG